ncbi:glycosyltransferase family 61 protein [Hymenobacter armeniacus]|uniref:Glycosyltransferase family 61 protein n=1 Tax=Hymenobacter armeniacus TaxID=2771358 RepID=A0ABR8K285_9BACT|nr:glycosyltransferase family 61 protein [Hymenobacter armeniacus]MBD2724674.1 glycosyltransferase family 61 protein [Hymenobacter armeniacus]
MYKLIKAVGDALVNRIARSLPGWQGAVVEKTFPARASYRPTPPANAAMLTRALVARLTLPVHFQPYHIYSLCNVHVTWDGAVFNNFRLFEPSIVRRSFLSRFQDTLLLRQWVGEKVKVSGTEIAVCHNQWSTENYYHWLIDSLPRLLVLRSLYPGMKLLLPRVSALHPVPEFIATSARLLGFTDHLPLNPRQILSAQTVILPDLTAASLTQRPELVRQVRQELLKALCLEPGRAFRRVYAARAAGFPRNLLNEPEVEAWLQQEGFEKVYFEHLTLLEQVRLMQETEVLLAVHGANMTNLLFLPDTARVVEIHNREYSDPCYLRLASCLGLEFYICPCQGVDARLGNQSDVIVDMVLLKDVTTLALAGTRKVST